MSNFVYNIPFLSKYQAQVRLKYNPNGCFLIWKKISMYNELMIFVTVKLPIKKSVKHFQVIFNNDGFCCLEGACEYFLKLEELIYFYCGENKAKRFEPKLLPNSSANNVDSEKEVDLKTCGEVNEILQYCSDGTYLVRPNCNDEDQNFPFVLSVRTDDNALYHAVKHFRIKQHNEYYSLQRGVHFKNVPILIKTYMDKKIILKKISCDNKNDINVTLEVALANKLFL